MPKRLLLLATMTAAIAATIDAGALAGPLSDAATKAEQQATSGDVAGARETLRQAVSEFSQTLPFAIGKAVFVTAEPAGYAMYEPKADPTFKAGEAIVSYVEPVGLTWKEASVKGKIQTRFTVDFDILNPKGEVLASQKAFGDFTFTGYLRNQEIYSTLTIDVTGAPAGDYVLRFHFNDINSGKSATVDQPFKIAAQ
ncbi:hypothetical protein [Sinorhizobium terangae]|uniref:Uncharacterized protein n=1 Tax=Sinorhizobium terangae TaxID=110322 RepID=A0A6N7LHW4_SINTE|nr:hypothetical protein [Sinorhizobium terangae]MBB4189498.1 hypothetical protein [Sinorhizobium terangae]MQX16900.1 hypothetical protein [Sinorhizobium terangae]WFU49037.1 hypothetical protein QA637_06435 [Sinorhizobium terangae]